MPNAVFYYMLWLLISCVACKKDDDEPVTPVDTTTRVITEGLIHPWEILWGPDNFIWMTERGGKISRVDPSSGAVSPLLTISEVVSQGEGGMLGMVLHPDFNSTPHLFVAYNYNNGGQYREKIVRYTYNGNTLVSPLTILDHIAAAGIHNGCRLAITPDQKLFITTGDASNSGTAQNTGTLNGKILRVNLDGSIPSDNPFPNNPVWSFGHRNPQGLVFANNILYSSEHGPSSDDEINIIEKGRNYGWPVVNGTCEGNTEMEFCNANNVRQPLEIWTPTVAVCGLDFYDNDLIPQWKNSLLLCTLKGERLIQLPLNEAHNDITGKQEYFQDTFGRLRDLCISPEGKVFLCTSNGSNDKIVEITKK